MKLAVKLALCLVCAGALVFAGLGWWLLRAYRFHSEELLITSAERVTDIIRGSTRHQMLKNDREALYQVIRDFGAEPGIRRVRIISKLGEIRFSTDAAEVGKVVDKNAEACFGCHSRSAPLAKLDRPDRARIFRDTTGQRVLAMILPIDNEPDCSNAACHAHPKEQKVLGVIDAHLTMQLVDERLASYRSTLQKFTLAALGGVTLFSVLLIWRFVYKPVRELIGGTRRVASGDLTHRLTVRSNDEIGELAREFNQMTADLQTARAEVDAWTKTLEQRVDRKTHELEQAHHSLLHSEKLASVGKLAATVAHEVNNPLFGILTSARLAQRQLSHTELADETKKKIGDKLSVIERESQRCGDIVKNLLTFSRQAPQKIEPVDLRTVIDRSVTLVRHQLELKNIQLDVNLAEGNPPLRGDMAQLQQVLLVLMVNATDAMPQGGHLWLSTELDENWVRIRVRDNGAGIPADVLPRIFEPFFSTKEDQQRTGLGLAIAFGIIEQHQGRIEVASTERQGTEFTISLPLVREAVKV
ncbi:MAG: HAMP domain-containing protein [Bryobacterales bacterium]|nr:HAMP domain-containing protein [Bryobacterales bacterium]